MKKKALKILGWLFLFLLLGTGLYSYYAPEKATLISSMAVGKDAEATLLFRSKAYIWAAKTGADGRVKELIPCRRSDSNVSAFVAQKDGNIYLLQSYFTSSSQFFDVFECREGSRSFKRIMHQEFSVLQTAMQLSVEEDGVYVSTINEDYRRAELILYRYDFGKKQTVSPVTIPCGSFTPVYGAQREHTGFYLTAEGLLVRSAFSGNQEYDEKVRYSFVEIMSGGIFYRNENSSHYAFTSTDGKKHYEYPSMKSARAISWYPEAKKAALLKTNGTVPEITFFDLNGTGLEHAEPIRLPFRKCFSALWLIWLCYTVLFVCIAAGMNRLWIYLTGRRRILYQSVIGSSVLFAVIVGIFTGSIQRQNSNYTKEQRITWAFMYGDMLTSQLMTERDAFHGFYEDDFPESELKKKTAEMIEDRIFDLKGFNMFFRSDLVRFSGDDGSFLISSHSAYGRKLSENYPSGLIAGIQRSQAAGAAESYYDEREGKQMADVILPLADPKNEIFLVVRVPVRNQSLGTLHVSRQMYGIAALIWLAGTILTTVFLYRKLSPLSEITTQMERISAGDFRVSYHKLPDNEIGRLWTSVEKMCKALNIHMYQLRNAFRSALRFVPADFEKLFDKSDLQEVSAGEEKTDEGYAAVVHFPEDTSTELIHQTLVQIDACKGEAELFCMPALAGLKKKIFLFGRADRQKAEEALQYHLALAEQLDENALLLLDQGKAHFSVAGIGEKAYPVTDYGILDALSVYAADLSACGIRFAVTDTMVKATDQKDHLCSLRYIGFVEAQNRKIGLYEVVNIHTTSEMTEKLHTQMIFAKALEQFYSGEYYKARSLFFEVVKESRNDGIARWYMFRCEELTDPECENRSSALFAG